MLTESATGVLMNEGMCTPFAYTRQGAEQLDFTLLTVSWRRVARDVSTTDGKDPKIMHTNYLTFALTGDPRVLWM